METKWQPVPTQCRFMVLIIGLQFCIHHLGKCYSYWWKRSLENKWCIREQYNRQQRTSWLNFSGCSEPPAEGKKQLFKQVFINILMTVYQNYRPLPVLNITAHSRKQNPDQQMSWQSIKTSTELLLDSDVVSSSVSVFASCKDLPCVLAVQFVSIEGYSGTLSIIVKKKKKKTKVKTQRSKKKEYSWGIFDHRL